jgi:hypothetical protein
MSLRIFENTSGTIHFELNIMTRKIPSPWGIMSSSFPRLEELTLGSSRSIGLVLTRFNIACPITIALLVNVDKFDTNPLLVNVNKLKPYWHLKLTLNRLESQIEGGGMPILGYSNKVMEKSMNPPQEVI